jgi:hypothetical protein
VLHPSATHKHKEWPAEHWQKLVALLDKERLPCEVAGQGRDDLLPALRGDRRNLSNATSLLITGDSSRGYHGVYVNGCSHHGREAAEILLDKQEKALANLERHGFAVKVNTVVIPDVNDDHVEEIARFAARFKVELMNCIGLIPVRGTAMSSFSAPSARRMDELCERAGKCVTQMRHCTRCRADAFGLLSHDLRIGNVLEGRQCSQSSLPFPGVSVKVKIRGALSQFAVFW